MKQRTPTHDDKTPRGGRDEDDLVDCFVTGQKIPRSEARLVRLGPGAKVWLPKDCCRPG